jgi:arylformamidase
MYHLLSYPLSESTPLYGDTPKIRFTRLKDMGKKDSCNTTLVSFCNHSGTHVDAPLHFSTDGRSVTDFGISDYVFEACRILDCPKDPDGLVLGEDLNGHEEILEHCDLLLIRTGFSRHRSEEIYRLHNPGISPCFAKRILEEFPNIRAIGIDSISVSPFQNREIGRKTHRLFLDRPSDKLPILLIEDMKIDPSLKILHKVFVIPILLDNLDGAPATVIAEI